MPRGSPGVLRLSVAQHISQVIRLVDQAPTGAHLPMKLLGPHPDFAGVPKLLFPTAFLKHFGSEPLPQSGRWFSAGPVMLSKGLVLNGAGSQTSDSGTVFQCLLCRQQLSKS
ncbi:unnamed protein product [Gadus morhua 'NCC']